MDERALIDMCVAQIMVRWPATIHAFVACELHCVGCPIGSFHTLAEAAEEHGLPLDYVLSVVMSAIAAGEAVRGSPPPVRHRSARAGAHP